MPETTLLEAVGGLKANAVEAALVFSRALWAAYGRTRETLNDPPSSPQLIAIDPDDLSSLFREKLFSSNLPRANGLDPDDLEAVFFKQVYEQGTYWIRQRYFSPIYTLKGLLRSGDEDAEIRYLVMRHIRKRTGVRLNAMTARAVHDLGDMAQRLATKKESPSLSRETAFEAALRVPLVELGVWKDGPHSPNYLEFALSVWEAIRALKPVRTRPGNVEIALELVTPSRLLAAAFGVPTSIPGFDEIFKGGIVLPDSDDDFESAGREGPIGSRTVVVKAPFGSGKSLLSLQMAVEVARKGGIAWVMALEQSPEECLYSLESIGIPVRGSSFSIVSGFKDAFPVLSAPTPRSGALFFLPAVESGERFAKLVEELPKKFSWLQNFRLRLLIIDPLSAIYPEPGDRARAVDLLGQAKRAGINLWLTSEQVGEQQRHFEENIADTVIRLGVDHTSSNRFIEVTKSRLQREKAGRHVLRITSSGLRIHPSPAIYLREEVASRPRQLRELENTGVPGFAEVLGRGAIFQGDVIALNGETGTSKTRLGLQFLRAIELPRDPNVRSLFMADLPKSQMDDLVSLNYERALPDAEQRLACHVLTLSIPPGLLDPGEILSLIAAKLSEQQELNKPVDRVLISNLSRWRTHMRSGDGDQTFALALIEILRGYGVTALLNCGYSTESADSELVNLLLEIADCALEVKRAAFRGRDRYLLRALKTHQMKHRRGRFEIISTASAIRVSPKESLLRIDPAGNVEPVPVLLFLHSETQNHQLYNEKLVGALRATLSPKTAIAQQTRNYDPQVLRLGAASALDEMQILQLDEFQLPAEQDLTGRDCSLVCFPYSSAEHLIEDRLPRFRETCLRQRNGEAYIIAAPFYANISLLAWQLSLSSLPGTWSQMANECIVWEKQTADLYFACHAVNTDRFESYNCLFLEILYSFSGPPGEPHDLIAWLSQDREKSQEAMRCFYVLLRRYHARLLTNPGSTRTDKSWQKLQNSLTSEALISRHWYNTLNQMFDDLGSSKRSGYSVALLPGTGPDRPHLTTAGEWYLAVPAYSAAPQVALDVIGYLTTLDNEMQRLHLGVSLPTRADYYATQLPRASSDVSPFFELEMTKLKNLVDHAFRRSKFAKYQAFAETMSSHLRRLLFINSPDYNHALDTLISGLTFVRTRYVNRDGRLQ